MVGRSAGAVVRAGQVLAGLDQDSGEPVALGGEHVGLDVIAHRRSRPEARLAAAPRELRVPLRAPVPPLPPWQVSRGGLPWVGF